MNKENEIDLLWIVNFFRKNIFIFIIYLVISIGIGFAYSYYFGKSYFLNAEINIAPEELFNKIQSTKNRIKDSYSPNLGLLNDIWQELFDRENINVLKKSKFFYLNFSNQNMSKVPTQYSIEYISNSSDKINEDFLNALEDFNEELKVSLIMSYNVVIDKLKQKNNEIYANKTSINELMAVYNEKLNLILKNDGSQLQAQEYYNIIKTIQSIKLDNIKFGNDIYYIENTLNFLNNFLLNIKNNNVIFYDITISDIEYERSLFNPLMFSIIIGLFLAFITSLIRAINKNEF